MKNVKHDGLNIIPTSKSGFTDKAYFSKLRDNFNNF